MLVLKLVFRWEHLTLFSINFYSIYEFTFTLQYLNVYCILHIKFNVNCAVNQENSVNENDLLRGIEQNNVGIKQQWDKLQCILLLWNLHIDSVLMSIIKYVWALSPEIQRNLLKRKNRIIFACFKSPCRQVCKKRWLGGNNDTYLDIYQKCTLRWTVCWMALTTRLYYSLIDSFTEQGTCLRETLRERFQFICLNTAAVYINSV